MYTTVTDSNDRTVVLDETQTFKKWFRDNHAELSSIAHKASVVRNSPLFRCGFSKGLLALGTHLFATMLIDTFPDIEDSNPNDNNKKTKFELLGKKFAVALTSEPLGKAIVTLKSNYKNSYLPEQEEFADYILIVQLMDSEIKQQARFVVLTYDVLNALPTKYTKKMCNIELHTKHVNKALSLVNTTFDLPAHVDQTAANRMIERAFEDFLTQLTRIADETVTE